jgi:hypothetical protein
VLDPQASNEEPLASDGREITMAIESAEETAVGKHWVEETLKRLGGEYNVVPTGIKWRDDFPAPYISMVTFTVGGTDRTGSIEFRVRQLEDCRNLSNRPVRAAMEQQIRDSLQALNQRLR